MSGSGSLSAASAVSDTNGYATVNLSVTNLTVLAQGLACVAPGNFPCTNFFANPVPLGQQVLQQVSGAGQVSTGQSFQAVVVRVVDSASSPHAVMGAPVNFLTTVLRPGGNAPGAGGGDLNSGNPAMPVILKVTPSNVITDSNGLASVVPTSGGFTAPVEVDVAASTGVSAFVDAPLFVLPAPASLGGLSSNSPVPAKHPIAIPVGGMPRR